jgi:hypothetical protein
VTHTLIAGLWLAPLAALLLGLLVLPVSAGTAPLLVASVGAALLAGAPAAAVAARCGAVVLPAALAAPVALLLAGVAASAWLATPLAVALPAAACAGALAALWTALAAGGALHLPVLAGAAAAFSLAWMLEGAAGAFAGFALGAGLAAVLSAAPLATAEERVRPTAGPAALGLLAAVAVLAAPAAWIAGGGATVLPLLAHLAALPGFVVLAASHARPTLRFATALLALGAACALLLLTVEAAPAAVGLIPPEANRAYRLAVLGAAFLPTLAALLAMLGPGSSMALPLLLLGLPAPLLAPLFAGTAWGGLEALAGPLLATGAAVALSAPGATFAAPDPAHRGTP